MHGNLKPSLRSKITSKANSSQANSQDRRIMTTPEEIKHTELGEIKNHPLIIQAHQIRRNKNFLA